jgi:hypothetical protein
MLISELKKIIKAARDIEAALPIGDPALFWDPEQKVFWFSNILRAVGAYRVLEEMPSEPFILHLRDIRGFLKGIKGIKEIHFEVGDGLVVTAGEYTEKLLGDPEPPPEFWPDDIDHIGHFEANCFYAMGDDPKRENLYGCNLEILEEGVRVVCTDGHRLATTRSPGKVAKKKHFISREVGKVLSGKGSVTCGVGETTAVFIAGPLTIQARYLDRKFPPWQNVIPELQKVVEVSRKGLLAVKGDELHFSAPPFTMQCGDQKITTPAEVFRVFEFAISGIYLREMLRNNKSEEIEIRFKNEHSVIGFDNHYIMPMRVR